MNLQKLKMLKIPITEINTTIIPQVLFMILFDLFKKSVELRFAQKAYLQSMKQYFGKAQLFVLKTQWIFFSRTQ